MLCTGACKAGGKCEGDHRPDARKVGDRKGVEGRAGTERYLVRKLDRVEAGEHEHDAGHRDGDGAAHRLAAPEFTEAAGAQHDAQVDEPGDPYEGGEAHERAHRHAARPRGPDRQEGNHAARQQCHHACKDALPEGLSGARRAGDDEALARHPGRIKANLHRHGPNPLARVEHFDGRQVGVRTGWWLCRHARYTRCEERRRVACVVALFCAKWGAGCKRHGVG